MTNYRNRSSLLLTYIEDDGGTFELDRICCAKVLPTYPLTYLRARGIFKSEKICGTFLRYYTTPFSILYPSDWARATPKGGGEGVPCLSCRVVLWHKVCGSAAPEGLRVLVMHCTGICTAYTRKKSRSPVDELVYPRIE